MNKNKTEVFWYDKTEQHTFVVYGMEMQSVISSEDKHKSFVE